jgi:hypothetical protein
VRVCLFRHSRQKRAKAIPASEGAPNRWRTSLARSGNGETAPDSIVDNPRRTSTAERRHDVSGLAKFEQRLEAIVSGAFARAFRSAVQPVEIAAALQRECDNNTQILSRQRRMVPNDFHVELSRPDLDRLSPYDSALVKELSAQLQEHAEKQSYLFAGPVTIAFDAADDLTIGRFRVRSRAHAAVVSNATNTQVRRARALLEVNGTRHPLQPPGLVVGRGTEADLRINDPGVSRRHIEFTVNESASGAVHISVQDLGSTNGMLVDGHRITSTGVQDGSTVKIGRTTLTVRVEEDADV